MPCVFECTVSHVAGTRRRIVRAKPVEGHPSRPPLHDADGRAAAAIAGALASSTTQAEASRTITTAAAIATAALAPAAVSTSTVASAAITTPSRLQQPLLNQHVRGAQQLFHLR